MIDVIYINVTNKDYFALSLRMLREHMLHLNNIYILNPTILIPYSDVITVSNIALTRFMKQEPDLTLNVVIMELNMGLLQMINGDTIPITYEHHLGDEQYEYYQDHLKPQLVKKDLFNVDEGVLSPLSLYYKKIGRIGVPDREYTVYVNKTVCCSLKSQLTIKPYVKWNLKGFNSLKKYLKM